MRKCWLVVPLCLCLSGCQLFGWLYDKPKEGGSTVAETIQSVAHSFGPWGDVVSWIIGAGGIAYGAERHSKHKKTHAENKKLKAQVPHDPPAAPAA